MPETTIPAAATRAPKPDFSPRTKTILALGIPLFVGVLGMTVKAATDIYLANKSLAVVDATPAE